MAALAQQAAPPLAEDAEEAIEEIIVTGSRIRRDEYSSAAPVQIIDGSASREIGLVDTTALLQRSPQATGTQIDNTFTAFVLDNGPASSQVNLRGLGAERVLLLLNHRRLAPGGVGGAPTSPDITTIPNVMIDRVEFLLDGASSVYGSDAVAGVVNVLLRKDFEGVDFEVTVTELGGGDEISTGIAYGLAGNNWNFGVAGEYYESEQVRLRDRSFTSQCNRYIYETPDGRRLHDDLGLAPGSTIDPCKLSTGSLIAGLPGFGALWWTPGTTNVGVPNFSETFVPGFASSHPDVSPVDTDGDGVPDSFIVDPDGDGLTRVDLKSNLYNFNGSETYLNGHLRPENSRTNIFAYADYDLGNEGNTSLYAELLLSRREAEVYSPGAQLFPDVPPNNPFNPCNQNAPGGVNCLDFFGVNFGNQEVIPVLFVRDDRDRNQVEINQYRAVAGIKGDLVGWNKGGFSDWSYDAYVSYSLSNGEDSLEGVLEPELLLSLQTSVIHPTTGEIVCGADGDGDGIPDGNNCVPVNLFHANLYQPGGGNFGSEAERNFLFGTRAFETEVEQTIVSFILQGQLFDLPWNKTSVPLVFGAEYREDAIDSRPNEVASEGLLFGFFKDGGANGSRSLNELFMETELELLEGMTFAQRLSLNLAFRWTKESTYGSDTTYSAKVFYQPINALTFRSTYGTSFRAPNAREQFLVGQSGFNTLTDPCVVPTEARVESVDPNAPATYNESMDDRTQLTLDNCLANGVDPRTLGLSDNSAVAYSVEVLRRGGEQVRSGIDPETSTSLTYGMVVELPLDNWTVRGGVTWYDVEVEDSIGLLSAAFLVNDCYVDAVNNSSPFCRFITRGDDGLLENIDSSFFNINSRTSVGVDYNLLVQRDFIINDRNLTVTFDLAMTQLRENIFRFEDSIEDDANTPIGPEWEGIARLNLLYDDFRFNWEVQYISGEQDAPDAFAGNRPCETLTVLCRPVARTDDYMISRVSFSWSPKEWLFVIGASNIFDEHPPLLDTAAPETQLFNLPLGAGYDFNGRVLFFQMRKSF